MNVGDRIRIRRLELGLSQHDLAIRMGYKGRDSVSKAENSHAERLTQRSIQKFADALYVTPAYLLGAVPEKDLDTDLLVDMMNDPVLMSLIKTFNQLNDEHRTAILEQIEFFINKEKKG